jgi:transglutaminase-like putative cysteine protease
MKLRVSHTTVYSYQSGSARVAMLLKLKPRAHEGQTIENWTVSVNDKPVTNFTPNGHGDLEALWISNERIDSATIVAEGIVYTTDMAGVMLGLPPGPDPMVYLRYSELTEPSDEMIAALAELDETDVLAKLHALSALVSRMVVYTSGSTFADTTAAQAFSQGKGVCQDHAHVFISMARALDIPARYVSGYMLSEADSGALHETHAWAEARVPALGWVGFDVANQVCITDRYIRLACGLDAHDAAPIRGTALSSGAIRIDADVRIDQSDAERGDKETRQAQGQRQQ